jgi:hypothetical protein
MFRVMKAVVWTSENVPVLSSASNTVVRHVTSQIRFAGVAPGRYLTHRGRPFPMYLSLRQINVNPGFPSGAVIRACAHAVQLWNNPFPCGTEKRHRSLSFPITFCDTQTGKAWRTMLLEITPIRHDGSSQPYRPSLELVVILEPARLSNQHSDGDQTWEALRKPSWQMIADEFLASPHTSLWNVESLMLGLDDYWALSNLNLRGSSCA